jgi:hypothetical protein
MTGAEKTRNERRSLLSFAFICFSEASFLVTLKSKKTPAGIGGWVFFAQSGCRDLNPGPLAPQTSTLTGLSYIPCFLSGAKLINYSDYAKKS